MASIRLDAEELGKPGPGRGDAARSLPGHRARAWASPSGVSSRIPSSLPPASWRTTAALLNLLELSFLDCKREMLISSSWCREQGVQPGSSGRFSCIDWEYMKNFQCKLVNNHRLSVYRVPRPRSRIAIILQLETHGTSRSVPGCLWIIRKAILLVC